MQVKFLVETRPDDPFIIIRKESIKKSNPLPMQTPRPKTSKRIKTRPKIMIRKIYQRIEITTSLEQEEKIHSYPHYLTTKLVNPKWVNSIPVIVWKVQIPPPTNHSKKKYSPFSN